jgi:uncharacterized protein YceK
MLNDTRTYRRLAAVCALAVVVATGCATIVSKGARNQTSGAARGTTGVGHLYTGVRCDASWVGGMSRGGAGIPLGVAGLVDMPFSLYEDTVFLPIDLVLKSDQPWQADRACGVDAR